jgi:adenosylhomocysteine nucleosidase
LLTAIISALAQEQAGLAQQLVNPAYSERAGRRFVSGQLHGQSVVLVVCGIGKVAAATTTTVLIEHFKVTRIVFTGVAGGLASGVNVGDVVVGSHYLQHDMDASPLFPRFEMPLYGLSEFIADPKMVQALCSAAQSLSAKHSFTVHQGLIVSGDTFVSSAHASKVLCAVLPEALCVEMEGAATAQVCHDYGVPFAAVRTISDRADDAAHIDFPAFVESVAGPRALALIQVWLTKN